MDTLQRGRFGRAARGDAFGARFLIYLDASAAISLFVTNEHSPTIRAIVECDTLVLTVSDFCIAEFVASVSRHVRTDRYNHAQGHVIIDAFESWIGDSVNMVKVEAGDVTMATGFIRRFDLGLRAPDALHIAICRRIGAALLTFDTRQAAAAEALGVALA